MKRVKIIDYAPLPNDPVVVDGVEFVPLRTRRALEQEAEEMQNCLREYWTSVRAGASRMFGMRADGTRATVELSRHGGRWRIGEIEAAANNKQVPMAFLEAAMAFVRVHNEVIKDYKPDDTCHDASATIREGRQ